MVKVLALLIIGTSTVILQAEVDKKEMVKIPGGVYKPFFDRSKDKIKSPIILKGFWIDKLPVTNAKYLTFVEKNPEWQKSKVKKIFADDSYLKHWNADTSYPASEKNKPVRSVSWFAANEYCESLGKVLPTTIQWEYVASADEKKAYALDDEKYKQRILQWYSKPSGGTLSDVGKSNKNYYGVYDMHGLIWEWTLDFNTALVTGESREDSILDKNKFCGSGSLGAKDKLDYGAFMRFGFRSSLKGNYTVANLGFRCVSKDGK